MLPAETAALIALAGVLISLVVSMELSRYTARVEVAKIRQGLTATYAAKLVDARLVSYREAYAVLSDFIKHIEGGSERHRTGQPLTVADARDLLARLVAWDTAEALLLSDHAATASYRLRQALILVASSEDTGSAITNEQRDKLLEGAQQLEIALKVDLGIYEVETHEGREFYNNYYEVTKSVGVVRLNKETAQRAEL